MLTDIEKPQYQVYLPAKDKATGAAAVVLPGGGYSVLAAGHEGEAYAKWLAERGIDPQKIGIMGSSAGGHLASLCATRFADTFPAETEDAIDAQSCRPDFAILIYPVISMQDTLRHSGSRERLLGKNPSVEDNLKYSTDRTVTKDTPPVFLLTASDDGVDCRNSLSFAAACKEHGVPVSLHLFETGGHGYGLNGKGSLAAWVSLLETWLAARFKPGK